MKSIVSLYFHGSIKQKSKQIHLIPDWHDPGDGDLNGVAVAGVSILTPLRVQLYSDHPGLF